MKSDYYERLENRVERANELAERHHQQSDARAKAFHDNLQMIPMGQPILIGHHSEKGHRAHLKRIDNHLKAASEHDSKARHFAGVAARAEERLEGGGPVMSDDPEAIAKIKAEIAEAERKQELWKKVNKAIRANLKKPTETRIAALMALGMSEVEAQEWLTPDCMGSIGVPSYRLSNHSANIRRMKVRLVQLEALEKMEDTERMVGDVRVVESATDNRLQLFFPGIPPEDTRKALKSHGFRWTRSLGCWQRHLNNGARWAAKAILGDAA